MCQSACMKAFDDRMVQLQNLLKEIGKKYNATTGQVALNWLITYSGETVITIPGATKLGHAQESAGAMKFSLNQTELDEINEVSNQ